MEFEISYISQKGRFHDRNEDAFVVHDDYAIVADGMGGKSSGDIASKLAIITISTVLNNHLRDVITEDEIQNLSFRAIKEADSKIMMYTDQHPASIGMGTTVVLIIKKGTGAYVTWCGDSRCYIYSEKTLRFVTKDHSYVQELIDDNIISIEESFTHPDNNLITKFVGGGKDSCLPEFTSCDIVEGSTIVLCSDGLSGYCKNEDIEKIVTESPNDELPAHLYQLAIKNGSYDDITIVTMTPKKKSKSIWSWLHSLKHSNGPK